MHAHAFFHRTYIHTCVRSRQSTLHEYTQGLMGKREAWHHFLVGAAGPESQLIQELSNGDFPRRLTAEVRAWST